MQRDHLALLTAAAVALALLVVGAAAAFGSAGAQEPADVQSNDHTIHVSATGEAETAPDKAILEVGIVAEGDSLDAVRDDLASGSENLTASLEELGVEYETSGYDIDQQRHPREERERARPEYVGAHSFTVTLNDTDQVGTVIDGSVDAGAEIEHVRLTLSDDQRAQLRDEAIEAAMGDARHQADTIAQTSGLEVTTVTSVDASQRGYRPVPVEGVDDVAGDGDAPPTEIQTGAVSVTYSVDVTYNATSR